MSESFRARVKLDIVMKTYRIATISGDGIGKEVVPEGIRVVDAAAKKAGIRLDWEKLNWSCEASTDAVGKAIAEAV
jgi:isocitrate/isopropylmalate dehydrogenase